MESRLKFQLIKSVDMFGNMDMVAVGNVILIGDTGNNTEALLQALGKLISGGLNGRAIQRIVNMLCGLPFSALIVHVLHNTKGKILCIRVSVTLASHSFNTFIQASVAKRKS